MLPGIRRHRASIFIGLERRAGEALGAKPANSQQAVRVLLPIVLALISALANRGLGVKKRPTL
jgi:hypothetical protein